MTKILGKDIGDSPDKALYWKGSNNQYFCIVYNEKEDNFNIDIANKIHKNEIFPSVEQREYYSRVIEKASLSDAELYIVSNSGSIELKTRSEMLKDKINEEVSSLKAKITGMRYDREKIQEELEKLYKLEERMEKYEDRQIYLYVRDKRRKLEEKIIKEIVK